jgi:hypothetical protein
MTTFCIAFCQSNLSTGVGFHWKLFRAEQGIPLIPVAAKPIKHFSCMPTVRIKCSIKLSSQNQFGFLLGDFLFKQVKYFLVQAFDRELSEIKIL